MGTDELTDRGRDPRPDSELLRLVGERDEVALRLLFHRHAPWLRLRLLRRCADDEVVDDALQDTFVAVWKRPSGFRGDGEVAAWLWGIAIRRLISRLRRHRAPVPSPVEMILRTAPVVGSAEEQLLLGIEHGDVGSALRSLSPELRAVVQATVIDGLTTREASQLLALPAGTVKSRMRAARSQLRDRLIPLQDGSAR